MAGAPNIEGPEEGAEIGWQNKQKATLINERP